MSMLRQAIVVLLVVVGMCQGAATDKPYGRGTLAPLKAAPVLDGKLAPGEWDGALATTGFQYIFGGEMGRIEPRLGTTWVGFTAERVYIAMVSEFPPDGKLHSQGTTRDKDYIFDEGIELWLDPNRAHREAQAGDLRFYQLIANAEGGIYDVSFDPKTGPNTGWNGNWEMANQVDHEQHLWTMELSLPFADLGWAPGEVIGKTLGVLVARNYKAPWQQATSFPVLGAFVDWYRYAALELTADAPVVQLTSLGEQLFDANLQLRGTVFNPGPARQVKVFAQATSSDMPEKKDEKVLDLPAGGRAEYAFDVVNLYHKEAQHALQVLVTSPDGAATYLDYRMKWAQAREKKWHYRIGPDPDAAVRIAYYPSFKFVRVMVDTRELGKEAEEQVKQGTVTIAGPAGQVLSEKVAWEKPPFTREFPVGELADGDYTVTFQLDGWKEPIPRTFVRRHFPWEGNKVGITDQVIAPFTPITVQGDTIGVVYRSYRVDGLGLWQSLQAAGNVNAGGPVELLARPMALVANGAPLAGSGRFTSQTPKAVVYEGQAAAPAVTVASKVTTEEDGCAKVELTLKPGTAAGTALESLVLDIPLKDALMPLWHASSTTLRVNPAGETPAGQGLVWQSTDFADGNWFGNFKCYLWFGAEERGLAVFGDNDAGWVLATDKKGQPTGVCQQLFRENGVLTLRLNLVQAPIVLTAPRTLTLGLMASPAKPMRADWRLTGLTVQSSFNMGYANPATFCAKYPWGNDWRIADWSYAKRTKRPGPTKEEVEDWKTRNFPADMDPKFRESSINLAYNTFYGNFRPSQTYFTHYFDEFHTTAQVHPESHVYQSEWSGRWTAKLLAAATVADHKGFGINTAAIVPSYRDFATWYAAEWVKRGIGCYFDNAFPTRAYDPLTTTAYTLPNGQVQPSAGIWARREYLRRVWTVHRTLAPPDALPALMIHMTNTLILPYMVWDDENLDLEWKFGPEIQQTKFHHAFLRAETSGRQTGSVPWALDKIMDWKSKEERAAAVRSRFGTLMVHEIRWWDAQKEDQAWYKLMTDFGYGQPDCQVYNYWNPGYPLTASDAEAKSLLCVRGGQALVILCTWNPQPAKVTFKLDTRALGFSPITMVDAEDATVTQPVTEQAFSLDLAGHAVRLFYLKP